MLFVFSCAIGMALGLYAGKKRAKGASWCEISSDLGRDLYANASSAWRKVSGPFRKDAGDQNADDGQKEVRDDE